MNFQYIIVIYPQTCPIYTVRQRDEYTILILHLTWFRLIRYKSGLKPIISFHFFFTPMTIFLGGPCFCEKDMPFYQCVRAYYWNNTILCLQRHFLYGYNGIFVLNETRTPVYFLVSCSGCPLASMLTYLISPLIDAGIGEHSQISKWLSLSS